MLLIPQDIPVYRVLSSFFGPDDHLYGEGEVIHFNGTPNEEMEPLNELARQKQTEYFDFLDGEAKKLAIKNGRTYSGRPKNLEEAVTLAREDARKTQLNPGGAGIPIMKGKKDSDVKIGKVGAEEAAETGIQSGAQKAKGKGTLSLGQQRGAVNRQAASTDGADLA